MNIVKVVLQVAAAMCIVAAVYFGFQFSDIKYTRDDLILMRAILLSLLVVGGLVIAGIAALIDGLLVANDRQQIPARSLNNV